jgi:hypothetical protein
MTELDQQTLRLNMSAPCSFNPRLKTLMKEKNNVRKSW